ncbi:GAF domain-containing protein [Chondrinema litorale]|uniref:GAF domain-containing protein n=1 Tax=Chondrinema litorale TaxID=2994555 RepID=UPI0025433650|nr:GAF domain-containing protein [Chondrinema litorale]UZR95606.1 GAF domain-containing protein [Chondrinema litorale]
MKLEQFNSIKSKIILGFLILLVLFSASAIFNTIVISRSESVIKDLYDQKDPSLNVLNEFKFLVTRSRELTTNWVYLIKDEDDKRELKTINREVYPELKVRLERLSTNWDSASKDSLDFALQKYEAIQEKQKEIMVSLAEFESYDDPLIMFEAEDKLEFHVLPMCNALVADLDKIIEQKNQEKEIARDNLMANNSYIMISIIISGLVILIVSIFTSLLTASRVTSPVRKIQEIIELVSKGELSHNIQSSSKDEIGKMTDAVNKLVTGLRETSRFAQDIGTGNYSSEFTLLGENDELGNALLSMRENLKKVADADRHRNWANEGYAKFGEILRSTTDSFEVLGPNLIAEMVSYLNANQGGIFIVNDSNLDNKHLELIGCYAWEKRKYMKKKILWGEGLAGQVWREGDTVFITDVPDDYIKITSGLGKANPKSILIVPLKFNQEIHGVMEIASFNVFKDYEIEFVERLSESIASTISSILVNRKTRSLLEESQMQSEELRMKDEEMRQNMEEMQATQEQIQRKEQEFLEKIASLETALDESQSNIKQ